MISASRTLGFRRKSAITTSFERWTLYWIISRVVLFIRSITVGWFGIGVAAGDVTKTAKVREANVDLEVLSAAAVVVDVEDLPARYGRSSGSRYRSSSYNRSVSVRFYMLSLQSVLLAGSS